MLLSTVLVLKKILKKIFNKKNKTNMVIKYSLKFLFKKTTERLLGVVPSLFL